MAGLLLILIGSAAGAWSEYNLTPEFPDAYSSPSIAIGTDDRI
jgi:hypothetical protein